MQIIGDKIGTQKTIESQPVNEVTYTYMRSQRRHTITFPSLYAAARRALHDENKLVCVFSSLEGEGWTFEKIEDVQTYFEEANIEINVRMFQKALQAKNLQQKNEYIMRIARRFGVMQFL